MVNPVKPAEQADAEFLAILPAINAGGRNLLEIVIPKLRDNYLQKLLRVPLSQRAFYSIRFDVLKELESLIRQLDAKAQRLYVQDTTTSEEELKLG